MSEKKGLQGRLISIILHDRENYNDRPTDEEVVDLFTNEGNIKDFYLFEEGGPGGSSIYYAAVHMLDSAKPTIETRKWKSRDLVLTDLRSQLKIIENGGEYSNSESALEEMRRDRKKYALYKDIKSLFNRTYEDWNETLKEFRLFFIGPPENVYYATAATTKGMYEDRKDGKRRMYTDYNEAVKGMFQFFGIRPPSEDHKNGGDAGATSSKSEHGRSGSFHSVRHKVNSLRKGRKGYDQLD